MNADIRKILVLGASGLIGRFVTDDLRGRGFPVVGVARKLSASQKGGALDLELPVMSMAAAQLARLLRDHRIDVVVNCLGVLQDGPGSDTTAVHCDFVARLLQAIRESDRAIRLVHVSIPGTTETDRTAFSTTKREAERLIAESGIAFTILRPGFVVALAAYGGSAMVRSLAAFPLDLPAAERAAPFQPVAMEDIAATVAWLAERDPGEANAVTWDLMQEQPVTLGDVIDHARYSALADGGASSCPRSCSMSAPGSATSRTGSAGCRRCEPRRSRNCAAASAAIPPTGWPPPASCRSGSNRRPENARRPFRTNGLPGCSRSRRS
jgi:uncharacterized protein YbjT (DUF2867 family)